MSFAPAGVWPYPPAAPIHFPGSLPGSTPGNASVMFLPLNCETANCAFSLMLQGDQAHHLPSAGVSGEVQIYGRMTNLNDLTGEATIKYSRDELGR